jgi:hypothetical protein
MKLSILLSCVLLGSSFAYAGQVHSISCSSKNPQAGVQALYLSDNFQSVAIVSGISYVVPGDLFTNLKWSGGTIVYNDGNGDSFELSGLPATMASGFASCENGSFDATFSATVGNFTGKSALVTCEYEYQASVGACQ